MARFARGRAAGGGAVSPARGPWNEYHPIMWSVGAPHEPARWYTRLRELGFTGEQCPRNAPSSHFQQYGLRFYVENLVPDLAYLHSRAALYDADFRGYTTTRDRKHLTHRPCLDDPAFIQESERRVRELVRPHAANRPLLYNLQDELSLGRFASPMDYCFCPHTLRAFREWLRTRYPDLGAMNAAWETNFPTREAVEPATTWEIKAREREALATGKPENYAAWADHREYMDDAWARTLVRLRDVIRKEDPAVPVGIEGTQMPSAWGGYDLWRLSQAVDWIEPYDIGNSRLILRSFLPPGAPVLGTVFGTDYPRLQQRLWTLFLEGDRGCIVWDDERARCIEKEKPDQPLTERGRGLARLFPEWKRMAGRFAGLNLEPDRVAIHYSQASIRAHWMFDSREDGDTWPRRFSSYEAAHSRLARVRDGIVKVVQDLGLQPYFVSYEQLAAGKLQQDGTKVLLLPQSVALSDAECRAVEKFARGGGTVIADAIPALMDEHLRRRPVGGLDGFFGVRQGRTGWRATPGGGTVTAPGGTGTLTRYDPDLRVLGSAGAAAGAAALVERRVGSGQAVFLNLAVGEYPRERLHPPGGQPLRTLFAGLLKDAGVTPAVQVLRAADGSPAPAVAVWRYRASGRQVIAVHRNPGYKADEAGAAVNRDTGALDRPEEVEIRLPRRARVEDLHSGTHLTTADRVRLTLNPNRPVVLELAPPSRR